MIQTVMKISGERLAQTMKSRVLSLVVNLSMMIAFLSSLILVIVVPSPIVSATVVAELPSPTVIAAGTRFVETVQFATSTQITTDVGRAETTPAPLLDSLARNKPSVWGSKGFYILLGLIYIVLLGLFVKQVLSSLKRQP